METTRPDRIDFEVGNYPTKEQFDKCELKYDGCYCTLLIEDRAWEIWCHTGNLKCQGELAQSCERTVLHGEYLFGTEWAKDRKEIYGRFAVFGFEMLAGRNYTEIANATARRDFQLWHLARFDEDPFFRKTPFLVDQWDISEAPALWARLVLGEAQFEGLVFKDAHGGLKAPMGRMKRVVTIDYVCVGFEQSDSYTYAGNGVASVLGGLFKDGVLVQVCRVSGLTNERREEFYQHPDKYIGKVFEAQGKKLSKRRALRHPDFLRWREDKLPEECKW